jgi:hypothetical protein
MDSSFLTGLHVSLGFFTLISFFKMTIQFGLPNHPARLLSYLVGICVVAYFVGLSVTDLGYVSPWHFMQWRAFPLIAGGLCLLFQTIMLEGSLSFIQQKVVSRMPLIGALLCFVFFSKYADQFVGILLFLGALFLIVSVRKARYQKRLFLKMLFMLGIFKGFELSGFYMAYLVAQFFMFWALFYLFLFQNSYCVSALVDDFKQSIEGDS